MHLSEKPTKYILCRATTTADFDSCDFALIDTYGSWAINKSIILTGIEESLKLHDFRFLSLGCDSVEFYSDSDDEEMCNILGDKTWCFIEIPEAEIFNLTKVQNSIENKEIRINKDGEFNYVGSEKGGPSEYYTDMLPLKQIVDLKLKR